jgi:hypothetical protein
MAVKTWQTIKIQYCHHVGEEVGLEAEVVYPPEWLPDQPPRVFAHRCSHGLACNLDGRASLHLGRHKPNLRPIFGKNNLSISTRHSEGAPRPKQSHSQFDY